MVTQKELVAILNARAEREKIQQEIDQISADLTEKRNKLDEKIKKAEDRILESLLLDPSEVENGKRFVDLKVTQPKSSVSWKGEYQELWNKYEKSDFALKEEELKKESVKGKKPTYQVVIK